MVTPDAGDVAADATGEMHKAHRSRFEQILEQGAGAAVDVYYFY